MKWAVLYSPTLDGSFGWVADEYGDEWEPIADAIKRDYSDEETPVGFYKIRPEFGPAEILVHKDRLSDKERPGVSKINLNPWEAPHCELQWRPHLTTHWQLVQSFGSLEEADQRGEEALVDWGGQVRVVVQSVVHAEGPGADEFIPAAIRAAVASTRNGARDA